MGKGPWDQKATTMADRELIPAGQWAAVLVALVDIGTQEERKYQSTEMEWVRKIVFVWELVGCLKRPAILKDFRLAGSAKSALRKFLSAWRGKAFADKDPLFSLDDKGQPKIIGQKCLVTVTHKESGDNIFHMVESASLPQLSGQPVAVADPDITPFTWSVELDKISDLENRDGLPYLYGRSLADRAAASRELSGGGTDEDHTEGAGQGENPTADDLADIPF